MKNTITLDIPEFKGFEYIGYRAPEEGEWIAPIGYADYNNFPVAAAHDFSPSSYRFIYKKLDPPKKSEILWYPIDRLKELDNLAWNTQLLLRSNYFACCTIHLRDARLLDFNYWIEFAIVNQEDK